MSTSPRRAPSNGQRRSASARSPGRGGPISSGSISASPSSRASPRSAGPSFWQRAWACRFSAGSAASISTYRFSPLGRLALELIGLALASGLAAGIYPALFISSFPPSKALKEGPLAARPSFLRLRRGLVAVQILCSATLIMVISVLVLQIRYIDRKDLGFKRDSILVIDTPTDPKHLPAFKNDLLSHPAIRGAATGFLPLLGAAGHLVQGPELW